MNSQDIIKNNECISKFIKFLKNSEKQYDTLTKAQERELIDKMLSEDKEEELRKTLVMHNIRFVFNIAKKYCKDTVDFDNMVAKGLYGLVYASSKFNLHMPIMVSEGDKKVPKRDKNGKYEFVKFNTYAKNWIFKYIVQEFNDNTLKFIDNYSISLDDTMRIKNTVDSNHKVENYINDMVSVDYRKPRTIDDELSSNDVEEFYHNIEDYLNNTNDLTASEKKIIIDSYYNQKKLKEIADELNTTTQIVMQEKKKTLKKIRNFVQKNMKITSVSDFHA